jgi:hypothetical protein
LTVLSGNLVDLDLMLASSSAAAGAWITYTVTGTDSWGNPVDADGVEVTTDGDLDVTADSIRGTVAGVFTVTASTTGTADHEDLEIVAGPVDDVEILLSSTTMVAGGAVTWSATYEDAYGNEVEEASSSVTADSPDVVINGDQITCTVAEQYLVRIDVFEGSEPWDSALLVVEASSPAAISLSLSPFPPEVDDVVTATAAVYDAYGNETHAPWSLSVTADQGSDPTSVLIAGDLLTFTEDGWFNVAVTIEGTQISDETGFFLVDSFGPEVDIWSPARGSWSTS